MGPTVGNLGQANYSLTAAIGVYYVFLKDLMLGTCHFCHLCKTFSRPINEITMQMNTIFSALAGAERVFAVMDMQEEDMSGVSVEKISGELIMEHVTFGYRQDTPVLKDICLYAKKGQKIAFVGSTGAGKTTITNLINRFYDVWSGHVFLDGVDINTMNRGAVKKILH